MCGQDGHVCAHMHLCTCMGKCDYMPAGVKGDLFCVCVCLSVWLKRCTMTGNVLRTCSEWVSTNRARARERERMGRGKERPREHLRGVYSHMPTHDKTGHRSESRWGLGPQWGCLCAGICSRRDVSEGFVGITAPLGRSLSLEYPCSPTSAGLSSSTLQAPSSEQADGTKEDSV